ncbi:MAG: hypothetical protein S4CHLAM102_14320 [Chlamydiia bacterium]|nr:hypothetical protein [Chlamydiia bacterium]
MSHPYYTTREFRPIQYAATEMPRRHVSRDDYVFDALPMEIDTELFGLPWSTHPGVVEHLQKALWHAVQAHKIIEEVVSRTTTIRYWN